MISQEKAGEMADNWLQAWNSRDIDQIMAHYADGIEFISPFIKALLSKHDCKIKGKPALKAYFLQGLAKYPSLNFQIINVLPGVGSFTLIYKSVNNLLAAEVMEVDTNGKVVRVLAHYSEHD